MIRERDRKLSQYAEMQQLLAGVPVTFTGYLSGDALADAYASADIFASPSRTETFGQAVLEAMAWPACSRSPFRRCLRSRNQWTHRPARHTKRQ